MTVLVAFQGGMAPFCELPLLGVTAKQVDRGCFYLTMAIFSCGHVYFVRYWHSRSLHRQNKQNLPPNPMFASTRQRGPSEALEKFGEHPFYQRPSDAAM